MCTNVATLWAVIFELENVLKKNPEYWLLLSRLSYNGFISYHGISTVISDESALLIIQYYYQRSISFQSSALCLLLLFIYFCWSAVCPLPVHHLITVKAVFNWTLTLLRRHVNIYKLTFYILMPLCKLILNFKQVFLWYCYSTNMLNQPTN